MDINKVTLIGRLTDRPEERPMQTGEKLAHFSIATNYMWKDIKTKQKRDKVEFHNVTVWGKLAEIVLAYLEKGSRIYLEGRLQHRSYEDSEQKKKYFTEIIADEIIMLGHNGSSQKSASAFAKEEPSEKDLLIKEV